MRPAVAEGGAEEPSPPSLTGVISRVELPRVLIRTTEGKIVSVLVEKHTRLFTSYGGGFDAQELGARQHASVWLQDCAAPSMRSRRAAVLTVCSLSAEPCAK